MKKLALLFSAILLITANTTFAAEFESTLSAALDTVGRKSGDKELLVLTDAPFVRIDDSSALPFLETVQKATGCTVGKKNLLFFQRTQNHPLRFLLMNKVDGKAVIISKNKQKWISEPIQLDQQTLATPEFWENTKNYSAAKDIFALAGIAGAWAMDAPYDYLKVAELHNHLCPGVTSGYLMAHYIKKHFPLKENEKYIIIGCPVWCKEDALQVILDCTAGKRGIVVKHLDKKTKAQINYDNPAGMVLVWNTKTKTGKAHALSFNFDILKGVAQKDSPKVAVVLAGLNHIDNPDQHVATAATIDLDEKSYNTIIQAGSNPYEVMQLMKK